MNRVRLFPCLGLPLVIAAAVSLVAVAVVPSWPMVAGGMVLIIAAAALFPARHAPETIVEPQQPPQTQFDGIGSKDIAAAIPSPIIIFNARGELVYANPPAEVVFGHLRQGISLQLKFRAPEMQELIEQTLAGQRGFAEVASYVERLPVERVFRVMASAIGDNSGLFALFFKDQSEARRIDRMRADFIANASHELRTPLASIAGFIETLRGPARNDPDARERFLQIMHNQTSRMARLINDLLSLSRLEMAPSVRPEARIDLNETVKSVVDMLCPRAAEAGVQIEMNLAATQSEIAANRDEIFQVFENLLENAIKYGQSGGRIIMSVSESNEGGRAEIQASVRDFGPGIAEEHLSRVTERFYRVDAEASRAQMGTGLGLAIVKHILTRHGARLSIRSQPGEGATFTAHFPKQ